MKYLFKPLILASTLLCKVDAIAQTPNWSVNPMEYQYSMTVTAIASKNCTPLIDTGTIVAAFQGTTCRGVSRTSHIVNGRAIASLVVYANALSGETINFKVFHKSGNEVLEMKNTLPFTDNAIHGFTGVPYELYTNTAPLNLNLSSTQLSTNIKQGDIVAILSAIDPDSGDTQTFSLINGDGAADNTLFAIEGDQLKLNSDLANNPATSFSIRIRVSDQNGCRRDSAFVLTKTVQTGLPVQGHSSSVNIYPIPAKDFLTIEADIKEQSTIIVSLHNIDGKNIMLLNESWKPGEYKVTLNINYLQPGIYVITINMGTLLMHKKITIL